MKEEGREDYGKDNAGILNYRMRETVVKQIWRRFPNKDKRERER